MATANTLQQEQQITDAGLQPLTIAGGGAIPVTAQAPGNLLTLPTYDGGQVAAVGANPTTPEQVDASLNQFQDQLLNATNATTNNQSAFNADETKAGMTAVSSVISPTQPAPTAPNFENVYNTLREERGLTQTEQEVNALKNELRNEQAYAQQRAQAAKREVSRQDAIAGRVSKIEEQENYRIDELNRQLAYKVDVLNSANSTINQIMQFKQMDYGNARQEYEFEFNKNMQLYNIFQQAKTQEQQTAMANLQIWTNLITSGNLRYSDMTPDQQLSIGKMELQAGLPLGFVSSLKMAPGSDIKQIVQRTDPKTGLGYIDTLYVNPDGSLRVVTTEQGKVGMTSDEALAAKVKEQDAMNRLERSWNIKLGLNPDGTQKKTSGSGSGGKTTTTKMNYQEALTKMQTQVSGIFDADAAKNPDKKVNWDVFMRELRAAVNAGLTTGLGFYETFKYKYLNPKYIKDFEAKFGKEINSIG